MIDTIYPKHKGRRFEIQINFMQNPTSLAHFMLWQAGEYSAVADYRTGEHMQECMEIAAYLDGAGRMIIDGEEYPGEEGSVFFIPTGSRHSTYTREGSSLRMFFLGFAFREDKCDTEPYSQMRAFFSRSRTLAGRDNVNVTPLINALISELYNRAPGFMEAIEHYVELIILMTWRNFTTPGISLFAPAYNSLYTIPTVYAVVRYIDEHIQSVGDIRSLAAELGFSYTYLSHLFSSKAGVKLQDYICRRRMEYACGLLAREGATVADAAGKCGYRNAAAFSRAFQREMGESPSEFMKKNASKPQ